MQTQALDMAVTLLKVSALKVAYGGIQAVKGVDLEVCQGELVSLIGSNGAGKTTTMKAITGSLPINDGDIEYLGRAQNRHPHIGLESVTEQLLDVGTSDWRAMAVTRAFGSSSGTSPSVPVGASGVASGVAHAATIALPTRASMRATSS